MRRVVRRLSHSRRTHGAHMAHSRRTVPHTYPWRTKPYAYRHGCATDVDRLIPGSPWIASSCGLSDRLGLPRRVVSDRLVRVVSDRLVVWCLIALDCRPCRLSCAYDAQCDRAPCVRVVCFGRNARASYAGASYARVRGGCRPPTPRRFGLWEISGGRSAPRKA